MNTQLSLEMNKKEEGYSPQFYIANMEGENTRVLNLFKPVLIETWKSNTMEKQEYAFEYDYFYNDGDQIYAEATVETKDNGLFKIIDKWNKVQNDTWQIDRKVKVIQGAKFGGFRVRLDIYTDIHEETKFEDFRYFAPPALYDKNDLDDDGIEDYLATQNLMYREDRLNTLSVSAYDEKTKINVTLIRSNQPNYDSYPNRPNNERVFLQRTDIGSLGVWNGKVNGKSKVMLRASYPFYEGEKCHALYMKERLGWESFWPTESGETIEVSYQIRVDSSPSFVSSIWNSYKRRVNDLNPNPVPLPATAEELNEYRLDALNRYYVELNADEDENEPAGYVLNCHPQNGEQLSNIIQFGFTGQNVLSAYNVLRYGYQRGNGEYVRRARKIVDFFVDKIHISENGMFYNLYSIDKKSVDFWWTGLLLPLAYAEGEELERLMGPLYEHRKFVIEHLKKLKGSYLRCMNEDAEALLLVYDYEKQVAKEHTSWLNAAIRYGDFLLKTQESDGSWYRAYTTKGEPITEPEFWFGTTMYEQKSSTATSIPFLIKLYQITSDERYLKAAKKAGKFVREMIVNRIKFNGGIHDSIYAKGQLIDNESIYFPMISLFAIYKATGDIYYLNGAHDAARINGTWTCLWDVPLPPESTLVKYGFRSTGIGACDTPGAGYVHPFELSGVAEMAEIAKITNDRELLSVAELLWHGCNQTVAVPGKDWGYRYIGLQEEGYLISWWAKDDPMFGDTGFGKRWKGEGNKTCFPWIPAVAVSCYWKLIDQFGTADFKAIKAKVNS
ncbi:hypothetical protein MUB24_07205 [Lederbergia sp. NSJ-179]|uniref:hypothetical protein n=1 Tax=Lederbergia sp. NSJ-179 TaxID=2931402 RepID=UPI001FD4B8D2|nr:hypothetical protein [Lederbergia sp. NSJ-179]MCJ7840698.1 hypothetical protein [Lederbergia sp. NSJ-179]